MKKPLVVTLIITGVGGIVAQILLIREFLIIFYGNELILGIILANWLILEAIGTFFLGKQVDRFKSPLYGFISLIIFFSFALPIAIYTIRILKQFIQTIPGECLGFFSIISTSFFILLPVSLSHGALFTFGCKVYSHYFTSNAISITKVYIYETLGTLIGGIGLTYFFIPYFHSFQIALGLNVINFISCLWLVKYLFNKKVKFLRFLLIFFLLLHIILFISGKVNKIHWVTIRNQWKNQNVIYYQNSIYGNITVTKEKEQYTVFSNNIPFITIPGADFVSIEEFVHFPMLFHPRPYEILVLSKGAGGIIKEILKYPINRIDYVELDPLVLKTVKKLPVPLISQELNDPKVNIHYIDGALFIKKTTLKYDLIFVSLSDPYDLQVNRVFTQEFFSSTKMRLKKEGILVVSLLGSLTYLNQELNNLNSCILNALKTIYPYIRVIPTEGKNLFLASSSSYITTVDSFYLNERLKKQAFKVNLFTSSYLEYRLHSRWQNWFFSSLKNTSQKINKDFQPIGVFFSLSYWNSLFSPKLQPIFRWFQNLNLKIFIIFFVFFTFLFLIISWFKTKKIKNACIPFCIFTTGFSGLIFILILIFTFQVFYGYVFYWIGILISIFMLGIVIGSLKIIALLNKIKKDIFLFLKLEVFLVLFASILPLIFLLFHSDKILLHNFSFSPLFFIFFFFLAGVLIGAEFPLANKIYLNSTNYFTYTVSTLYTADLLGGCLGGLIGGVFLLPILGLFNTCIGVVICKIISLVVFIILKRQELKL